MGIVTVDPETLPPLVRAAVAALARDFDHLPERARDRTIMANRSDRAFARLDASMIAYLAGGGATGPAR